MSFDMTQHQILSTIPSTKLEKKKKNTPTKKNTPKFFAGDPRWPPSTSIATTTDDLLNSNNCSLRIAILLQFGIYTKQSWMLLMSNYTIDEIKFKKKANNII